MSDFPKRLYKDGTEKRIWGVMVDTLTVDNPEGEAKARSEGWRGSPLAEEAVEEAPADTSADEIPALRCELEEVKAERDRLRVELDAANDMLADATAPDVKIDGALPQLDHDGDGKPGGSLPGEASTATIGRRKREKVDG